MSELTLDSVQRQLDAVEAELNRRRYLTDPVAWDHEVLHDHTWSGQQDILRTLEQHRKTAVMTCHGIGKSFIASVAAGWWLATHKPGDAFVITTAPTAPQVKVILWKEIGRVHARGHLLGRVNQVEWIMEVNGKEETVAIGRKPSDYSPTAFQGIHAPRVLVIVDEANGVRGALWDAIDSLIANEGSKMLAIFNPDEPSGEIYDACKPDSGWVIKQISAFDTPNFTGEKLPKSVLGQLIGPSYVEDKRRKWAPKWKWAVGVPDADKSASSTPNLKIYDRYEDLPKISTGQVQPGSRCIPPADGKLEDTHPFWQSKILGQFPVQSGAGSLIPLSWIRAAQERNLKQSRPIEMGLDVGASEGGDPSCLGIRRGGHFRILYEERQPDTMKTLGRMLSFLISPTIGADCVKVDYIGVGRGVVDFGRAEHKNIHPISVGMGAQNPREFANLLSELWWNVRGYFERGEIDLDEQDEDLAEELLRVRWEPNSRGQTHVSYCDGPSPNRADALMLAFAPIGFPDLIGDPIGIDKVSIWTSSEVNSLQMDARSRWRT